MATLETIKNKIQNLIDVANETTEESHADLTSAIDTLIDGYMSGESAEYFRYVTFMNADNETIAQTATVEPLYSYSMSKAPYVRKEPTIDTAYSLVGWSLTPNGEITTSALAVMKDDVTLYPIYEASVRKYTVSFYNGGALVHTESVPYGGSSSYTHEIPGAWFLGWNPVPENITSDIKCYGTWEYTSFGTDSWARIAEISKANKCSEHYSVGETREIILNNGKRITVQIAALDGKMLSDRFTRSHLTIVTKNVLPDSKMAFVNRESSGSRLNWYGLTNSNVVTYLNEQLLPLLPADLLDVLPEIISTNECARSSFTNEEFGFNCKLFVPSCHEVYGDNDRLYSDSNQRPYPVYKGVESGYSNLENKNRIMTLVDTGKPVKWWTRTPSDNDSDKYVVLEDGSIDENVASDDPDAYVAFAFCL